MSYASDRAWADSYIPALRYLVGPLLLEEAPLELDAQQATDLIIFTARDMRIACRVRKVGYADEYPWDITVRSRRDSGTTTELAKIIDGWGDWLVYAHAADDPMPRLSRWFVVDLDVFRSLLIRDSDFRRHTSNPRSEISNGDGSWFIPYDVRRWPTLVVAASHLVRQARAVA